MIANILNYNDRDSAVTPQYTAPFPCATISRTPGPSLFLSPAALFPVRFHMKSQPFTLLSDGIASSEAIATVS
jgi:hypothetical protein